MRTFFLVTVWAVYQICESTFKLSFKKPSAFSSSRVFPFWKWSHDLNMQLLIIVVMIPRKGAQNKAYGESVTGDLFYLIGINHPFQSWILFQTIAINKCGDNLLDFVYLSRIGDICDFEIIIS